MIESTRATKSSHHYHSERSLRSRRFAKKRNLIIKYEIASAKRRLAMTVMADDGYVS